VVGSRDVCDEWADVRTGVYADPRFIKKYSLSLSEAQAVNGSLPDPELVISAGEDIAMLKADIAVLLRQNECTSPDIKLFSENLLRFANAEPPFQRSSECGMDLVLPVHRSPIRKCVDADRLSMPQNACRH
jgi:hypothetical protein